MDGVSVNDAVINNPNPLLVVNGKLSESLPVRVSTGGPNSPKPRFRPRMEGEEEQPRYEYVTNSQYTR